MMPTKRLPTKQPDMRPPRDTQAKGVNYTQPHINKNRDDITQAEAYSRGHKGASKPQARKWYYVICNNFPAILHTKWARLTVFGCRHRWHSLTTRHCACNCWTWNEITSFWR